MLGKKEEEERSRLVLQATPTPTPQRRQDAPRLAIKYTDITEAPAARSRNQKAQRPSSLRPHFNPFPALPHLLISSPIGQSGVNTAPESEWQTIALPHSPDTAPTPLSVGGSEIHSPALSGAGGTDCGPQRNLVTVGLLAASPACLPPSRLD